MLLGPRVLISHACCSADQHSPYGVCGLSSHPPTLSLTLHPSTGACFFEILIPPRNRVPPLDPTRPCLVMLYFFTERINSSPKKPFTRLSSICVNFALQPPDVQRCCGLHEGRKVNDRITPTCMSGNKSRSMSGRSKETTQK